MVQLSSELIIGEGNSRMCYLHPDSPDKIIKIEKVQNVDNYKPNNKIEDIYMQFLISSGKDLSLLPKYYGIVDTNLGKGIIFEKIKNSDNSEIFSFKEAIIKQYFSQSISHDLLVKLIQYLRKNLILFVDISFDNILCRKNNDTYELIIIDGLGSRKLKLNFWLNMKFKFLAKRKVLKQTKKMFEQYQIMLLNLNNKIEIIL